MQGHTSNRPDWPVYGFAAAIPALLACGLAARQWPDIWAGGLINPDSYMRLVRLRDIIGSGAALHVVQNDGSGAGTVLHWSHLLDSIVLLMATPFGIVLTAQQALHLAAMLNGPLSLAMLGATIAWAASPWAERRWLWLGGLLAVLSPSIGLYGLPGVLHHHVDVVTIAIAQAGLVARMIASGPCPRHAWHLGAVSAFGAWLTPETLPVTILSFAALWVAWVLSSGRCDLATAMRSTGGAFAVLIIAALVVDPPATGYGAMEIDRLSAPIAALAVAMWGTACHMVRVANRTDDPAAKAGWSLLIGTVACAAWLVTCPAVLRGSGAMLADADWHVMLDDVVEMRPVTSLTDVMALLFTGALTTAVLAGLALRHRSAVMFYAAVVSLGLIWLGQTHCRFAAYPQGAAALMLPVVMTLAERAPNGWASFARPATIVAFVSIPYLGQIAQPAHAAHFQHACNLPRATRLLNDFPGRVVLTDVNDTPEVLYRTGALTVGSLYHRNPAGFLHLRAAWRSGPSDTIPDAVSATGASLVLLCDHGVRSFMVADLPADTLMDRLAHDDMPPWLALLNRDEESGYALYAIRSGG